MRSPERRPVTANDAEIEIVERRPGSAPTAAAASAARGGGRPGVVGGADPRRHPVAPAAAPIGASRNVGYATDAYTNRQHRAILERYLQLGSQADEVTAQQAAAILAETEGTGGASGLHLWGYHADDVAALRAEMAAQDHQRRHQRQAQQQQQAILAAQMQDRQQRARAAQAQAQQAAQAHQHTLYAVAGGPAFAAIDLAFSPRAAEAGGQFYALDPDGAARASVLRQMQAQQQQAQQQQEQQRQRAVAVARERQRQQQAQQQQRRTGAGGAPSRPAANAAARAVVEQARQRQQQQQQQQQRGHGGRSGPAAGAESDPRMVAEAAAAATRAERRTQKSTAEEERGTEADAPPRPNVDAEQGATEVRQDRRSDSPGEPTEIISLTSSSEDEEDEENDRPPEKEPKERSPRGPGAGEPEESVGGNAISNAGKKPDNSATPATSEPSDLTKRAVGGKRGEPSVSDVPKPRDGSTSQSSSKKQRTDEGGNVTNVSEVAVGAPEHHQGQQGLATGLASAKGRLTESESAVSGVDGEPKNAVGNSDSRIFGIHDKRRGEEWEHFRESSEAHSCVDIDIAGPFVAGLLAGKKEAVETLEGNSVMAVHNATCKVFDLLQKSDQEHDKSSAKSTGKKKKGKSSDDDAVTLHSDDVERIASEFVSDRRQVAKDAVQIAFLEMKKRHDAIVDDLVHDAAGEQEKMALQINTLRTKDIVREEADAIASQEVQRLREQNKKLLAEAGGLLAENRQILEEAEKLRASETLLRERHRSDIADLKNENSRVVTELRKKYDESLETLSEEMEEDKTSHSRALNAYMTASCSALRTLRKNEEVSHMI